MVQGLAVCAGRLKVRWWHRVWPIGPGHAVNTSVCARLRHPWLRTVPARLAKPCASRPVPNSGASLPAFSRTRHAVGCLRCCAWQRDRVRQGCRTRAYRDVFTACPVAMHSTEGLPNSQSTTSNEQRATSNECEETTGQSRKQYASALPRTAYPMKHLQLPGQATSVLAPTPDHAATTATGAR